MICVPCRSAKWTNLRISMISDFLMMPSSLWLCWTLLTIIQRNKAASIGFFMMERSVQGHGIGSRIITELCVYLHSLGYEYIRLGYVDGNKQSESFWKKNQFTDTGLRNHTQDYTVVVMNRML
ncbi:MAG: GNAT family N-acetyltransferase [Faecalibacterium sp.]